MTTELRFLGPPFGVDIDVQGKGTPFILTASLCCITIRDEGAGSVDYRTAAKEIASGQFRPVYVCYGPETYQIQEFIHYLIDKWIEPADREFAVSKFDLAETNVEAVIDDAETPPFLGGRKLIIAKDAVFFTSATSKMDHHTDRLLAYLKAPADYCVVVFTAAADKLDERKRLVKTVGQALVPFPLMSSDQLRHWVRRQSDKLGFVLEEAAEQTLLLNCGANLQTLAGELQKLALFAGSGGTVNGQTVERLVSKTTEQNVFLMIDELVRLRVDNALRIFHELLKQKEEPIKILALMARQFRHLLLIKQLSGQGVSQQQMASLLALHPYAVKIAAEQAGRYEADRLRVALSGLAEADYRMKTGQMDKVLALELFMLKLAA